MNLKTPSVARIFTPESIDKVHFGSLSPLPNDSPWSVVALVRPTKVTAYAGIVSKRSGFSIGANHFTFWLKDGFVTIESDVTSRRSELSVPLNGWSVVGAAASADGSQAYVGTESDPVVSSKLLGLTTGTGSADQSLAIGKPGNGFPGAIAYVCLYSTKLDDSTMRAICSGEVDPTKIPSLAFAWKPGKAVDTDLVSKRVSVLSGTKLWTAPTTGSSNQAGPVQVKRAKAKQSDFPPESGGAHTILGKAARALGIRRRSKSRN